MLTWKELQNKFQSFEGSELHVSKGNAQIRWKHFHKSICLNMGNNGEGVSMVNNTNIMLHICINNLRHLYMLTHLTLNN